MTRSAGPLIADGLTGYTVEISRGTRDVRVDDRPRWGRRGTDDW